MTSNAELTSLLAKRHRLESISSHGDTEIDVISFFFLHSPAQKLPFVELLRFTIRRSFTPREIGNVRLKFVREIYRGRLAENMVYGVCIGLRSDFLGEGVLTTFEKLILQ